MASPSSAPRLGYSLTPNLVYHNHLMHEINACVSAKRSEGSQESWLTRQGYNVNDFAVVTFNAPPDRPPTFKYEVLGQLSLLNHQHYCERHGYAFVSTAEIDRSRPACWAKLPALIAALQVHEWVLWADSDTLVFNPEVQLQAFCDPAFDLVVQN